MVSFSGNLPLLSKTEREGAGIQQSKRRIESPVCMVNSISYKAIEPLLCWLKHVVHRSCIKAVVS